VKDAFLIDFDMLILRIPLINFL